MARVNYTNSLQLEYIQLYRSMEIRLNKLALVNKEIDELLKEKSRYEEVGEPLGVPWYFVALVHRMESSGNFAAHLHNGDPLTKRTRQVPKGRPKKGKPPFTWEESAIDALKYKKLHREDDWSLPRILYQLEKYNGWGYRLYHQHVFSPYLWSYCDHYDSGKYVRDGTFSDTAVSQQVGAAVFMRRLEQRGEIPAFDLDQLLNDRPKKKTSFYFHSKKREDRVDDLQRFLNSFPGISLLVDGQPGNKTSTAVRLIFGNYLKGDRRKK